MSEGMITRTQGLCLSTNLFTNPHSCKQYFSQQSRQTYRKPYFNYLVAKSLVGLHFFRVRLPGISPLKIILSPLKIGVRGREAHLRRSGARARGRGWCRGSGTSCACAGSEIDLPGDGMLELIGDGHNRDETVAVLTLFPKTQDHAS
jgi:hypothetical protein